MSSRQLELLLRYNAQPNELKIIKQKSCVERTQFICDLFTKNHIKSRLIQHVHLCYKLFHSYTAYLEFQVSLSDRQRLTNAISLWRRINRSWSLVSDIWLSPLQYKVFSKNEFDPPPSLDLELDFFSFGTILGGHNYVRCTQRYSAKSKENGLNKPPKTQYESDQDQSDDSDSDYSEEYDDSFDDYDAPHITFSFSRRMFYLYFNRLDKSTERFYCLELSWARDLEKRILVVENKVSSTTSLYLQIHLLPKIYQAKSFRRKRELVTSSSAHDYLTGDSYFKWLRKSIFPGCQKEILGNCTAIELKIVNNEDKHDLCDILMYMKSFGFMISYCRMKELKPLEISLWTDLYRLSYNFDIYWALKSLYSRGYMVIQTLLREPNFKLYLQKNMRRSKRVEKALYDTASLVESERYVNILKAFEHFLSVEYRVPAIEYKGLEYVKSVVITPLRIIYNPPAPVMSNRILRDNTPEYFIRVSFRDESMDKLMLLGDDDDVINFFDEVIYQRLSKPLIISDRQYTFLACSNSQLRSHGMWFYSMGNSQVTADDIRTNMGDLSNIQNVASYVSRMGQCFSNTQPSSVEIRPEWLKYIDDVERNDYCFSDGTGMISVELRDEVAHKLGHRQHSLYQIRLGGCKGTVAVNPDLEGKQLLIRKSMKKFESSHRQLEICREADAHCHPPTDRLYLNHQSIMLLEQLGVHRHVFLRIQEKAIYDLLDMMLFENKAATMIDHMAIPGVKFKPLVKMGVSLIMDPFIRKILLLILYKTLDSIKSHGCIELPLDYARNLMGTMDTTDTLEYGEVFVQYSADLLKKGESSQVLTGDVIITKFPAVHKGDMRRFVARDVPALHHMVDCIVFPSQGPRPHPDEMAGSDLDGDEYFVTWLPDFLDSFQTENLEPMDYTSKKKVLGRPVRVDDMYRYITDYIQNDNLGRICNALKVLADTEPEGFLSEKCVGLAKKISMAVDFPKTEIPVTLDISECPTQYPNFMGKEGINCVYNSDRVLGDMYRVCSNLSDIIEECYMNKRGDSLKGKAMLMPRMVVTPDIAAQARSAYSHYANGLSDIMHKYGIVSEEELISGKVINLHKRLNDRKDMFMTLEIVRMMVSQLRDHFRKLFFQELGYDEEPENLDITDAMRVKAVAWYNTVYTQDKPEFYSFAWIVADIVGDVVRYRVSHTETSTERISESMKQVYTDTYEANKVTLMEQFGATTNEEMHRIGKENPGVIVLWMFVYLWCKRQRMDYDYVHHRLRIYLRRHCLLRIPKVLRQDILSVLRSHVVLGDMKTVIINGESVGAIMLAFLRHHGSQNFLQEEEGKNLTAQRNDLHCKSLKAYFHLAVYNDCRDLLFSSESVDRVKGEEVFHRYVIIPPNVWWQIRESPFHIAQDIRKVFRHLTTVNVRRHNRGKWENGSVFANGVFGELVLMERVLNAWFSSFSPNSRYEEELRRIKENM